MRHVFVEDQPFYGVTLLMTADLRTTKRFSLVGILLHKVLDVEKKSLVMFKCQMVQNLLLCSETNEIATETFPSENLKNHKIVERWNRKKVILTSILCQVLKKALDSNPWHRFLVSSLLHGSICVRMPNGNLILDRPSRVRNTCRIWIYRSRWSCLFHPRLWSWTDRFSSQERAWYGFWQCDFWLPLHHEFHPDQIRCKLGKTNESSGLYLWENSIIREVQKDRISWNLLSHFHEKFCFALATTGDWKILSSIIYGLVLPHIRHFPHYFLFQWSLLKTALVLIS